MTDAETLKSSIESYELLVRLWTSHKSIRHQNDVVPFDMHRRQLSFAFPDPNTIRKRRRYSTKSKRSSLSRMSMSRRSMSRKSSLGLATLSPRSSSHAPFEAPQRPKTPNFLSVNLPATPSNHVASTHVAQRGPSSPISQSASVSVTHATHGHSAASPTASVSIQSSVPPV